MDVELGQCLMALPSLVAQMEEHSVSSSVDLNLIEWFILRTELFLELLRVLNGGKSLLPLLSVSYLLSSLGI